MLLVEESNVDTTKWYNRGSVHPDGASAAGSEGCKELIKIASNCPYPPARRGLHTTPNETHMKLDDLQGNWYTVLLGNCLSNLQGNCLSNWYIWLWMVLIVLSSDDGWTEPTTISLVRRQAGNLRWTDWPTSLSSNHGNGSRSSNQEEIILSQVAEPKTPQKLD